MVKENNPARARKLFNELNTLRVVFLLYLGVIRERCVFRRVLEELESGRVEGRGGLVPAEVMDFDLVVLKREISVPYSCLHLNIDALVCSSAIFGGDVEIKGACCGRRGSCSHVKVFVDLVDVFAQYIYAFQLAPFAPGSCVLAYQPLSLLTNNSHYSVSLPNHVMEPGFVRRPKFEP